MDDALAAQLARRERTLGAVRQILIDALKVKRPPETIDPDAMLFGSGLGLDSVDALELVIALEARYQIRVDEDAFRSSLRTVNSVADLILAAEDRRTAAGAR
jgi:acyl carrier protein